MFKFGKKSLSELEGVDDRLVAVVHRGLELTPVDFSVHDGLRTFNEQKLYYQTGVSRTMESKHLRGLAVDLVPYINGKLRWEWPPIYEIAEAMRKAAVELELPLRWGGCWDINFTESNEPPSFLVKQYVLRQKNQGNDNPLLDGPHFEVKT